MPLGGKVFIDGLLLGEAVKCDIDLSPEEVLMLFELIRDLAKNFGITRIITKHGPAIVWLAILGGVMKPPKLS